uniref:Uncharacterized protein n=1 Tax=Cryptomonas curvata TaxID=233186 RepID=A0A7S0QF95_9CRYP
MAAASRPSALGAGAAGVGAWQTAVQFLAPIQSAPTPPITSAPSDLSGGGDGGRGADQTKSWSQSIERAPSDAGSGGGFSASSAGGDSAAGSSAARQMWMKAASSAAARIGSRTPIVSPSVPPRLRKMGSATTAPVSGDSSADEMIPISRTRSWNGSFASSATAPPRRVPSFRPLKVQSNIRP